MKHLRQVFKVKRLNVFKVQWLNVFKVKRLNVFKVKRLNKVLAALGIAGALILSSVPAHARTLSATFYSDWYQGRKMANGKRFSQGAMVAAHPSYRFGTRLRVSYKGRSVVVVVSDRCRCSLDLSKAAFRQLAPLSKGRIPVKVSRL